MLYYLPVQNNAIPLTAVAATSHHYFKLRGLDYEQRNKRTYQTTPARSYSKEMMQTVFKNTEVRKTIYGGKDVPDNHGCYQREGYDHIETIAEE